MTTTTATYCPIPALGDDVHLYRVAPGIRADYALTDAWARLSAARDTLRVAAGGLPPTDDAALIWSAYYLVEQVVAVLEALDGSLSPAPRRQAEQEDAA
ncbi:hypothetical protein [Thiorhodococcus minor]|uniref:DUF3077 domain-containing protein n=1 Tax=Thiorhodococcus minor TaxID=57489 RepID=A0A6M0JYM2_9GAMM|nr:hypothetical protein [Thiorhodococcus minor]NEV62269.1 hypothetical protein [Thiorhodococcus minor]